MRPGEAGDERHGRAVRSTYLHCVESTCDGSRRAATGGLGFEPRLTGSEPVVLPLHHPPNVARRLEATPFSRRSCSHSGGPAFGQQAERLGPKRKRSAEIAHRQGKRVWPATWRPWAESLSWQFPQVLSSSELAGGDRAYIRRHAARRPTIPLSLGNCRRSRLWRAMRDKKNGKCPVGQ